MSRDDKLIVLIAIIVIILSFGWCIKILLGAPIVKEIKEGATAIMSGVLIDDKSLINK